MQYSLRNTIILAVLLLLILSAFVIVNTKLKNERDQFKGQLDSSRSELEDLKRRNPDYNDIVRLERELQELLVKAEKTSKIIPKENNPSLTYLYLLDICDRHCPDIDFDFDFTGSGNTDEDNVLYNGYELTGEANIQSLYSFIYQIENQIMFNAIESIDISEVEEREENIVKNLNRVAFRFAMKSFYDPSLPEEPKNYEFRNLKYANIDYNPFLRRVHEPFVSDEEEQYLNLEYSYLIGLTPEKVFLRDAFDRVSILVPGDKVAYGYLDRIDWEDQSAVFKINDTGITVEKKIYLNKE
jgi:hypothetical protein